MTDPDPDSKRKSEASVWKRRCLGLALLWITVSVATSFATVRGFLITPLHVHQSGAVGDFAYVMADGPASWERLRAASDLYHQQRVGRILLLNQQYSAGWNFVREELDSRVRREIDYLVLFGVPEERIFTVPSLSDSWMSSLSEAQSVAKFAPDPKKMVVVTSPPHSRRSRLCFRRVFPQRTEISVYSPDDPGNSAETHFPIWIEYAKLIVYWFFA